MMDTPPEPLPVEEQRITQSLIDCGLKAEGFTVRYEDYLQSIEIIIKPAAGAGPEQFACIHDATFPEIVTFENRAMFGQYMAFGDELVRPEVLAEAEAELKKRKLWEGFPDRSGFATLDGYVRALEQHAGFAAGSMLRAEGNRLVFDPRRGGEQRGSEDYSRILAVMLYAAAKERLQMGFIGNNKVRE